MKANKKENDFQDKEHIGVMQSPSVTFPMVNEFENGSSYRR